jgi:DNA end-binding protein Ku
LIVARAIWKGVIVAGSARLPVKLYSAVQDRSVHFRLLHAPDAVPVRQHMVHPGTGRVVESADIRRGYEVEPGRFVILDDGDLEATEPEPSRDIEVLRFVPASRIDGTWYDRPYHLGPDVDTAAYFAFRDALAPRDRVGLVRWAMRRREYIGAIRVRGEHLMLVTLRHPAEVVQASALPSPAGRALGERALAMAEQLISTLEGPFDPAEFRDEYRDRVLDFVRRKAEGEPVTLPEPEVVEEAGSLEEMLERSLARGRERAVA